MYEKEALYSTTISLVLDNNLTRPARTCGYISNNMIKLLQRQKQSQLLPRRPPAAERQNQSSQATRAARIFSFNGT